MYFSENKSNQQKKFDEENWSETHKTHEEHLLRENHKF